MAVASGAIAYAGTYTVNELTKTINLNVEISTFPNLVGAANQRRIITFMTADEMKFVNPRTPAGVTLEFVWKRAKYEVRTATSMAASILWQFPASGRSRSWSFGAIASF
jgi:hypothetical protein